MVKINRRKFISGTLFASAFALIGNNAFAGGSTPAEIEGPFYPLVAQKDKDFDLTLIDGNTEVAKGTQIFIQGKILDMNGLPIEDATVDLWQANAAGRYRHPHDDSNAAIDPNFQGWAIVQSGKNGEFRFKTIVPGTYLASKNWMRPPHIHFKVTKKGYVELVTQMYFPGNKLNDSDLLLQRKNKEEQALMISSKAKDKGDTLEYNIILQKAG